MIKVVHLITSLGLGGAENQLSQLVLHSDSARFKHIVISMQDMGQLGAKILEQGIPIYTLNMRRKTISINGIYKLFKILRQEKPDILQTWLYHADLLGTLVGKYLKFQRIIWNVRCSNMDRSHYSRLTGLVMKLCAWISSFPKAVIVNSSAGQKAHQTLGYKVKKWINIPNGFNTERFVPDLDARKRIRSDLKIPENTLVVGMVARFDPMKDHAGFLVAARKILKKYENIQFILIGTAVEASNHDLMSQINNLELTPYTHLLGPKKNIQELLNALDILVLPSAFGEGFPNVLGEAMSCGIPCVATDVGDSANIIADTGAIVSPSDPEALAGAIIKLLNLDTGERKRLGELARKRIIDNYHFPNIIKRYEKTYEDLCAE